MNNTHNIPLALAVWLATDNYAYGKDVYDISATNLLRSPRYIIGSKRLAFPEVFPPHLQKEVALKEIDIIDKAPARFGTAIHSSVEQAWLGNYKKALKTLGYSEASIEKFEINPIEPVEGSIPVYLENRISKEFEVNGIKFNVTGQYDLVINGRSHSIKTTSSYSYTSGCNDENYILQESIYRLLNPEIITDDIFTVNFVITDFVKYSKHNENYPPAKVCSKNFRLLSLQETQNFIRNKLKQVVTYWDYPLNQIPCCTDSQLYRSNPTYKYYMSGNTNGRATKVFNTLEEARAYQFNKNGVGTIVKHLGNPFYCDFCTPETTVNTVITTPKYRIE